MTTSVSLDGLGMDHKAMLELVNRMNAADEVHEWVLVNRYGYGLQAVNPFIKIASYGAQQVAAISYLMQ